LYEGCAPGATLEVCVAHLTEIRSAGFLYVLNYSAWYGSPEEVRRYADAAAALGLQLIWPLNHPAWRGAGSLSDNYASLGEGLAESSNAGFLSFAIDLVGAHPATWGFYIGDEVPPAEADRVGALSASVRARAPDKPQLYVARPAPSLLEPFLPFADVAGIDSYPVGSGEPRVREVAAWARTMTSGAGVQTAMVLQAFSWSQYRPGLQPSYPSQRRLRIMRDRAIRYAEPAMILWYSYQDILRSDAPQKRWSELWHAAFAPPAETTARPVPAGPLAAIYSAPSASGLPNPVLPAGGGGAADADRGAGGGSGGAGHGDDGPHLLPPLPGW
jgi:hypothetical protein